MPDNYVPSAEMAQTLLNIQTEIRAGLILPPQTEAALGFNLACHRANRIIRDYLKGRGRAPKMTAPAQECAADAVTAKVTKRWDALRRIVLALYVAASEQNAADAERRAKKTIAQFLAFAAEKRATDASDAEPESNRDAPPDRPSGKQER
jgi:hypothetical protein